MERHIGAGNGEADAVVQPQRFRGCTAALFLLRDPESCAKTCALLVFSDDDASMLSVPFVTRKTRAFYFARGEAACTTWLPFCRLLRQARARAHAQRMVGERPYCSVPLKSGLR